MNYDTYRIATWSKDIIRRIMEMCLVHGADYYILPDNGTGLYKISVTCSRQLYERILLFNGLHER